MPYKSESIKLKEHQDRRRKLSEEQKVLIKEMYDTGAWSLNKLSVQFGVSKKTILLIVNQASAERSREYRRDNWREFQRTKEERALTMREHRRYKQLLYLSGELDDT